MPLKAEECNNNKLADWLKEFIQDFGGQLEEADDFDYLLEIEKRLREV